MNRKLTICQRSSAKIGKVTENICLKWMFIRIIKEKNRVSFKY